ncbi:hypothetical protein F66182_2247 [Fusarium sp. NRRL 66182]|nr:hypothetical protein F66182_2247 [Fusarium sp. NRRL 66182]
MEPTTSTNDRPEDPSSVQSLLSAVSSALDKRGGNDIFAIGGNVEDEDTPSALAADKSHLTLRWDQHESGQSRTLKLPVGDDPLAQDAFTSLLKDCAPATFGLGDKEVLDEEYRKAGKLDNDRFCSSFNPYEHGIVDTINQVLAQGGHSDARGLGIKAELYKLNASVLCSLGQIQAARRHATIRSTDGLACCGQLAVRHGGREIVFDWASRSADTIQWAAFFSNCEHEVLQVTRGHRVTLTYNLFWTNYGPASMGDHLQALDQEALHFYTALENLLSNKDFLKQGGHVGFTCTHAYPHTSKSSLNSLRHMLKGLDMVVYQALKRILGAAHVTACLDAQRYEAQRRERKQEEREYQAYLRKKRPQAARARKQASLDDSDSEDVAYISSPMNPAVLFEDFDYERGTLDPGLVTMRDRHSDKPFYHRTKVAWLNYPPDKQASKELAVAFITYGNEPGVDAYYSSAVIGAKVERELPKSETASREETSEWSD